MSLKNIFYIKRNLISEIETIPLYFHRDWENNSEVDFKGELISVEINSINNFFETLVVPQIIKDSLDLLADESLDNKDVKCLNQYGLNIKIGDILNRDQIKMIEHNVRIFSITVEKDIRNEFYIHSMVLDPLKRLWQISPGHYSEGWDEINDNSEDLFREYVRINPKNVDTFRR